MSRRKELKSLAHVLLEIIKDEFESALNSEDPGLIDVVISLMSDAYDFGREDEAAEFIKMAQRRLEHWKG